VKKLCLINNKGENEFKFDCLLFFENEFVYLRIEKIIMLLKGANNFTLINKKGISNFNVQCVLFYENEFVNLLIEKI